MDGFSPKKLAQMLVEKHDRFISEYSDETERVRQLAMLTEKRDQLIHWVEEKGSRSKYAMELQETEGELEQLQSAHKPKSQGYFEGLRERIEGHKEAKAYWLERIGGLKT